jgi:Tfp pilus assembly protein PilN
MRLKAGDLGADRRGEMKAINLLPNDLRGAPKGPAPKAAIAADEPTGIGAYVVLGVLAACVLALAAHVLTTNTVKDRQAQLEAATAQAAAATKRVNELKPYADFQAMAETRIQTVKDLASSRFDWEQALRDVSRAIPANVTLTSLNGTISGDSAGGGSTIRSSILAPAIELKGCTRGQAQVATLLSRLRNVDGVTRVSLSKSLKPAVTPTTAGAPVAPNLTGCGQGRPPAFELVMFFERSEVPATVQDITVQASAAAPQTGTAPAGGTTTPPAGGVTTPPADPATATPTPQGGGS